MPEIAGTGQSFVFYGPFPVAPVFPVKGGAGFRDVEVGTDRDAASVGNDFSDLAGGIPSAAEGLEEGAETVENAPIGFAGNEHQGG